MGNIRRYWAVMTSVVSAAVAIVVVLLSLATQRARMEFTVDAAAGDRADIRADAKARIDELEARLVMHVSLPGHREAELQISTLNGRLEATTTSLEARFTGLERRLDRLETKIDDLPRLLKEVR